MKRAFTLVELLVAITIFSVVLSITSFSFRFFTRVEKFLSTPSLEEIENLSKLRDSVNSLFFFLSENERTKDLEKKFNYFFKGDKQSLSFVAAKPLFGNRDNLYIIEIRFQKDTLYVREYPIYDPLVNYKNPSFPSKIPLIPLFTDIKDFTIEYFKDSRWLKELKNTIPELIKFSYSDKTGNRKVLIFSVNSDFYRKKDFCKFLYNPF